MLFSFSCAVQNQSGKENSIQGEFTEIEGELIYFKAKKTLEDPCLDEIKNDSILKRQILSMNAEPNAPLLRKLVKRNIQEVMHVGFKNQNNRELIFNVYVVPNGQIIAAKYLKNSTAILDEAQTREVLIAVCGYTYEPRPNNQCVEVEELKIILQNIKALNN